MLGTGLNKIAFAVSCIALLVASGCSNPSGAGNASTSQATGISGSVGNGGGQQTIAGAMVQLYAVGTSGDASAAKPLFTAPLTTDASGFFHTDQSVACDSATTMTYFTAIGRDFSSTSPSTNQNLALIAVAGPCGSLKAPNYFYINDVSTISAVSALGPFIASESMVGSAASDAALLEASFQLAGVFYNLSTGYVPSASVPSGDTVPQEKINTLGNILFSCVNSRGGVAGDNSDCGNLFALTTPAGAPAPTNTIGAAINLLANPASKTAALFALASPSAPSQPVLSSAPGDFSITLMEPATISIEPSFGLDFSSSVGTMALVQTVTLENSGTSPLTVGSVTVNGIAASDYSLTTACTTVLNPGSSCSVQVRFSPSVAGYRQASLQIVNSLSTFIHTVPLRGIGT